MTTAKVNETVVGWDEVLVCAVKEHTDYFGKVHTAAEVLDISKEFAAAVVYLRTQPHWTQALEDTLITMYKSDTPLPSMMTWGK